MVLETLNLIEFLLKAVILLEDKATLALVLKGKMLKFQVFQLNKTCL
jgi:hypothetical protein